MLNKKSLIININKSRTTRKTKIDYIWKDIKEYKYSLFIVFVSLLFAILSNGAWIAMILNYSISSELFWELLKLKKIEY